mmetsp:Transcript_14692/g.33057  ORF Transcript_14692/g.33057 Transcript_14692/m.33057 type:complete len:467 (+) Transcript_14692:91-1491(+)
MEADRHAFTRVPVWDQPEDVTLLTSLKLLALRKKACIHKKRLEEVQATLDIQQIEREVDALHAKAEDFRMTRVHKSDEAADKLRRDNLRMVSKLHTVVRDAEVRHKQLSMPASTTTPRSSLNSSVRKKRFKQISRENADILDRLRKAGPTVATADELSERYSVHTELLARRTRFRRRNVARMLVPPMTKGRPEEARPQLGKPHYMRPTGQVATLPPLQEEAQKPHATRLAGVARAEGQEGGARTGQEAAIEDVADTEGKATETPVQASVETAGAIVAGREDNNEEFEESGAHALPPVEACDVQCHTLTGWRQFGTWPALPSVSAANLAGTKDVTSLRVDEQKAQAELNPSPHGQTLGADASGADLSHNSPGKSVHEYTDDEFETSDEADEVQDDTSKDTVNASMTTPTHATQQGALSPVAQHSVDVERYGSDDDYDEDSESDSSEESISRAPSEDASQSSASQSER